MFAKLFGRSKEASDAPAVPEDAAAGGVDVAERAAPAEIARPWLHSYPEGVPAEIADTGDTSLVDVLDDIVAQFGPETAFVQSGPNGMSLTYNDVKAHSIALARYLISELGVAPGDRIALMSPNTVAYPLATAAALRAGAVLVNVNPLYTERELRHQLTDSGAETVFVFDVVAPTLAAVIADTPVKSVIVIPSGMGPEVDFGAAKTLGFLDAIGGGAGLETPLPSPKGDDLALLQYTGGTTGLSKGAMLTHKNLVANIRQCEPLLGASGFADKPTLITILPLYHVFAFTVNMFLGMVVGSKNILVANPRDLDGLVETFKEHKPTAITGVNTLFNMLVSLPQFADIDLSNVRVALGGGAAVQAAVSERWHGRTGMHIKEGYGLSETSPVVTFNPPMDHFSGNVGMPVPSTEVTMRDDSGNILPLGEAGEICVRGPQVMRGYWNRPETNAEVFTADGFFRTGDIGVMDDDGFIRIEDRKKDMVIVSGFNVYPNEVEAVVVELAGVGECACVGVPDERTGEAVKLYVVKSDPALTEDAVIAFCRERLAAYKVPRIVVFLDELPKSTVGKILRRELRDRG